MNDYFFNARLAVEDPQLRINLTGRYQSFFAGHDRQKSSGSGQSPLIGIRVQSPKCRDFLEKTDPDQPDTSDCRKVVVTLPVNYRRQVVEFSVVSTDYGVALHHTRLWIA